MKKLNFVKDGAMKLPPGFRFQPTDEEIVFQYLARKITSSSLPASIIPDIDNIFKYSPWNLPGDNLEQQDRYFFSKKEAKYRNGNKSNRAAAGGSGYWKATGADKQIMCPAKSNSSRNKQQQNMDSSSNIIMGMRKTLVFHMGKHPHCSRTNWIMHEYRLLQSQHPPNQSLMNQMGDWVLCHIFQKNGSSGGTEDERFQLPVMRNLTVSSPTCSSSSSCSSSCSGSTTVITEVCPYESDHEDTSSCNI